MSILKSFCLCPKHTSLFVLIGYTKTVDEGLQLGDYPQLQWRSAQENVPNGWWDDQDRRNKETPVSCLSPTYVVELQRK